LQTSLVRGSYTPLYASPQQVRGEPPDVRDDVHALGVIWYQLLTGDLGTGRPGGVRWRERLAERGMAPSLPALLARCFEADRAARPADAAVLADRLQEMLYPEAPPPIDPPRATLGSRRAVPASPTASRPTTPRPPTRTGGEWPAPEVLS